MIDAQIPLGVKPIQIDSPVQSVGQLMQLRGIMTQQLLHQAQLEQAKVRTQALQADAQAKQRDLADSQTFQRALADTGGDWNKAFGAVTGKIAPKNLIDFQNKHADTIKAQSLNDKQELENQTARLSAIGSGIGAIAQLPAEQRQSEYSNWLQRQRADKNLGPVAAALPDQWSDDTAQGLMWQGTATKQILEAAIKAQEEKRATIAAADTHLQKQAELPGVVADTTLKTLTAAGEAPIQPKDVETIAETARRNQALEEQARLQREQAKLLHDQTLAETRRGHNLTDARQRELADIARETRATERANKPLPAPAVKSLETKAQVAEKITSLADTFKDEYSGNRITGGLETAIGKLGGERVGLTSKGQTDWWQSYQDYINTVRKELFGSALTATEKAEFEKAIVNERTDPTVVKTNLARQRAISDRAIQRAADTYQASGYNKDAVDLYRPQKSGGMIRARDPQGNLHEAPAGTPLPAGWKVEP